MVFQGSQMLDAAPEKVFSALLDPKILSECIPGIEDLKRENDTFSGHLEMKVAFVRIRLKGKMVLLEAYPDRIECQIEAQSSLGKAFARATVRISQTETGSQVDWEGHPQLHGLLSKVDLGMWKNTVSDKAQQFFRKLEKALQP